MRDIEKRLAQLERLVNATQNPRLFITLDDAKIKIDGLPEGVFEMVARTPIEAVEIIEHHILGRKPEHVVLSYGLSDIFDLYPEYEESFGDFAPIPCAQITTGDYYTSCKNLSLRHIFLFNHVHTLGRDTGWNRANGIIYTEDDFRRLLPDEGALFDALYDIISKIQHWRETSGEYKPDSPGYSYGNPQYGAEYLRLRAEEQERGSS